MRFSRLHKWVTYLIAGLGLWALSLGGELSTPLMAVMAVAYVLSWFAEPPRIARPEWTRAWTTAVVGALGIQVMRALTGEPPFRMALEFAALLTISRLFNRRTAADFQQIIVLAFLHLIAGTVLTTGLSYGLIFVGFVVVTPWMLALTHLRVEIEAHHPVDATEAREPQVQRVLASRRIVGPAFLGWTAALSVPLFISTIAMFVLFPRVGFGLVSLGDRRGQAVAGFGNDIELGGFGMIRDDPTVVMRVSPDRDISPTAMQQMLRLRGTAFDHYDGRRWTRTETDRKRVDHAGDYYALRRAPRKRDVRVRVVLENLDQPVLFIPEGTVGLKIPYVGTAGRRHSRNITRGHGFDLRYDNSDETGLVYEAFMSTDPEEQSMPPADDVQLSRYLQLPSGHDALIDYARRLTVEHESPADKARTLLKYLRDSGRFQYSLQQADSGGGPPLMAFLFGHKQGHCEYFATALAILLRAVGVPTRNVTGFVGGTFNRYGGYFAVQQGQAHSWVEALLPNHGWVTLDPTPASRERAGPSRSLFALVGDMIDAARTYWLMEVIGYDLRTQLSGLRAIGRWFKDFRSPSGPDDSGRGSGADAPPVDRSAATLVLLALLTAAGGGWLAWRLRSARRPNPERQLHEDAERARRLYVQLESALARRGKARPPSVTPRAHADTLEREGFPGASIVRKVTDVYMATRYGGERLGPGVASAMAREVEALKKTG